MIRGRRVTLRPMEPADTDDVVRWRSDPETLQQMFSEEPPTPAEHLQWLADIQARDDREEYIIVERESGRPIGTIGLSHIDTKSRHAEYGILIGRVDARGKGLGSEATNLILDYAFNQLDLHKVYLQVFPENASALRLYERVGFRTEGLLRRHCLKRGVFRDVKLMAVLKEEWSGQ